MGKFYTIQTIAAWDEAQRIGYLVGNRDFIWPDFLQAYHWMMDHMRERLLDYEGEYPIWIWPEKQDLRKSGYLSKGEKGVQLELNVPDNKVLWSDFQAWHFVLNYWTLDVNDDEIIDREESWERIFDYSFLSNEMDWNPIDPQGVTGKIPLQDIKIIKEFTSR